MSDHAETGGLQTPVVLLAALAVGEETLRKMVVTDYLFKIHTASFSLYKTKVRIIGPNIMALVNCSIHVKLCSVLISQLR